MPMRAAVLDSDAAPTMDLSARFADWMPNHVRERKISRFCKLGRTPTETFRQSELRSRGGDQAVMSPQVTVRIFGYVIPSPFPDWGRPGSVRAFSEAFHSLLPDCLEDWVSDDNVVLVIVR